MSIAYYIDGPTVIGTTSQSTTIRGNASFADVTTTPGDMLYATTGNILARIPAGSAGQFLQSNGGSVPTWTSSSSFTDFDGIVSTSGNPGTFPLLSAAVAAGKKSIYVEAGTYTETASITIPLNSRIIGQKAADTIIIFAGVTTPALNRDASGGIALTSGTISINSGSSTVTGSGTSFNTLAAGDYILIVGVFYIISNINSNTSLTISEIYRGRSVSGISYVAYRLGTGFRIEEISIRNSPTTPSTSNGMFFKGLTRIVLRNLVVSGFNGNVNLDAINNIYCQLIMARNSSSFGISMTSVYNSSADLLGCANNIGAGLIIQGTSFNITLRSPISNNNGSHGIQITGNTNVLTLEGGVIENNVTNGIDMGNGTSNININSCVSHRNTIGVNFQGDQNLIVGCTITQNSSTGIQTGRDSVTTGNHVSDNGGIGIDMASDDRVTVTGNAVHDNGSHGISVSGSTQYCTITSNTIFDNGGRGINSSGPAAGNNIITGNNCRANSGEGIFIASDGNVVSSNRCIGNSVGVSLSNTADSNIVSICNLRGNSTSLTNAGTNTSLTGNLT